MFIWIVSYPKSVNTWVRSLLSSYYFTNDGSFNFSLLKNIEQYPQRKFFDKPIKNPEEISNYWEDSQKKISNIKKIKFFKTHNSFIKINGKNFTSPKYTLGVVYIIRDPRNVITSLKNHWDLSYEDSLKFMQNDKKFIYDKRENNYADFHFLSSWSNHYKSWLNTKEFNKIFIKYEDLEKFPYETFSKIINFINKISKIEQNQNKAKIKKSIASTSFNKLKSLEKKHGFEESVTTAQSNKKINFFHMGSANRWQKILPKNIKDKANSAFHEDLKLIGYY